MFRLGPEVGLTPRQCDDVPIRTGGQALDDRVPDTAKPSDADCVLARPPRLRVSDAPSRTCQR